MNLLSVKKNQNCDVLNHQFLTVNGKFVQIAFKTYFVFLELFTRIPSLYISAKKNTKLAKIGEEYVSARTKN